MFKLLWLLIAISQMSLAQQSAKQQTAPTSWSIEYPTSTTTSPSNSASSRALPLDLDQRDSSSSSWSTKQQATEGGGNLSAPQDSLFDEREPSPVSPAFLSDWSYRSSSQQAPSPPLSVAELNFIRQLTAFPTSNNSTHWLAPLSALDMAATGSIETPPTTASYNTNKLGNQHYQRRASQQSSAPSNFVTLNLAGSLKQSAQASRPSPIWSVQNSNEPKSFRSPLVRDANLIPIDQFSLRRAQSAIQPLASQRSFWQLSNRPNKKRSADLIFNNDGILFDQRANYDDQIELARSADSDLKTTAALSAANGKGDFMQASYATVPLVYDSPIIPSESKRVDDEQVSSLVDNLLASSRYSSSLAHPMPTFYAYPAFTGHKVSQRESLKKSLATPILVGIGAALISFLIISNLFLSIPLFAMTLMQLFGGGMMMPSNQNAPTNGQTTNGRRRRDANQFEHIEQHIKKAIEFGRY